MRSISTLLLLGTVGLAGCGGTATNNTNMMSNANLRGANTNTGYVVNSETNVKPTIPAKVTNISPPSITGSANHNTSVNANSKANVKRQ